MNQQEPSSSPDLDSHLDNLIEAISDDCDNTFVTQCVKCQPEIKWTTPSPTHRNSPVSSSLPDIIYKHSEILHSFSIGNGMGSGDVQIKYEEEREADKEHLDDCNQNTNMPAVMFPGSSKEIINDASNNSDARSQLTETAKHKNNAKRRTTDNADTEDINQNLYPSSSWPCDYNKMRKLKQHSESDILKISEKYNIELTFTKSRSDVIPEVLLEQAEYSSSVNEKENDTALTNYDVECSILTSSHAHDVQYKKTENVFVSSQFVQEEPFPVENNTAAVSIRTSQTSSVSPQKPATSLEHSACSQLNNVSCSAGELLSVRSEEDELLSSHQAALTIHVVTSPYKSSNQNTSSVFSTPPSNSNHIKILSAYSSNLTHEYFQRELSQKEPGQKEQSPLFVVSGHILLDTVTTNQNNDLCAPVNKQTSTLPPNSPPNKPLQTCCMTYAEEDPLFITGMLCNDFHFKPLINVSENPSSEFTQVNDKPFKCSQSAELTPLCRVPHQDLVETKESEQFTDQSVQAFTVDQSVKIIQELSPAFHQVSPTKISDRSKSPLVEKQATEHTKLTPSGLLLEQTNTHSASDYKYQDVTRSSQMLTNVNDIPYDLPNSELIVSHCGEPLETQCCTKLFDGRPAVTDNDHTYKEESKHNPLIQMEKSHASVGNCASLQNYEVTLSWPKLKSCCTEQNHNSTRIDFSVSPKLANDMEINAACCREENGISVKHFSDRHHSNDISTLLCKDNLNKDEQRVPEIKLYDDSLPEVSLYSDHSENGQSDLKGKQEIKQAFQWNSVYETIMNRSLCDETAGESALQGLSSITPLVQCHRPLRVGLSRKQNVKHLHNKP